jgi:two-component sensor histidine kinase
MRARANKLIIQMGLLGGLLLFGAGTCPAQTYPFVRLDEARVRDLRTLEQRARLQNDSLLLGKVYYRLGKTYSQGAQNTLAQEFYLQAQRVLETRPPVAELGLTYLGLIDGLQDSSYADFQYLRQAMRVFRRIGYPRGMAMTYNRLTSSYKSRWLWPRTGLVGRDSAKYRVLVACIGAIERYARQARDTSMLIEARLQSGDLYRHLNDRRVFGYYQEALALLARHRNDTTQLHALCLLTDAYLDRGQTARARDALEEAQKLEKGIEEYWAKLHVLETLERYYSETKQWQRAYELRGYLRYVEYYRRMGQKEGIISTNTDATIALLNLQAEARIKEADLKNQQRELRLRTENLRIQRWFTAVTTALLLLTAGLCYLFFRLYRKNQQISRRNAELVREQNHRVKNNLQAVSSLLSLYANRLDDPITREAVRESQLRVEAMAVIQRKLYDQDRPAAVTLREFIPELVRGVLQSYGYGEIAVEFELDDCELSGQQAAPLGLILNELTTNACKYAFPVTPEPGFEVSAIRRERVLELTVADNGPGLPASPEARPATDSFGMELIRLQVRQVGGKGGFVPGGGTRFQCVVPLVG